MRHNENAYHSRNRTPQTDFFLVAQRLRTMVDVEPSEYKSRRKHPRESRSISLSVQPLDEDFQKDGDLFWVVSRDISLKGVGLICPEPIDHQFIRVGLLEENVSVIGRVCHNTSIGSEYPLYLVGVEFIRETEIF